MARPSLDEYAHFVRTRSGRLRLIARTLTADHGLADDLVQEALERTWLHWGRLDNPDPMAWTRTVLVNLTIDRHRRRRITEQPLPDEDRSADQPSSPSGTGAVDDQLWVQHLLTGLTAKERAVIVLRYLEDLSEADTATALGIPRGTVKSTCSRALDRLRTLASPVTTTEGVLR
ncbi:SigE family RNA polymerase sigma factor [Aestuariimicrobium soli]|uniref:SigE family RNA polymerase sigma factor n=1 Tax=Aestuariimicrobium soli TaxID=2035834 RepID=UPI003EBA72D0